MVKVVPPSVEPRNINRSLIGPTLAPPLLANKNRTKKRSKGPNIEQWNTRRIDQQVQRNTATLEMCNH